MQDVKLPPSPLDELAPDNCLCGYGDSCICPDTERALRFVQGGSATMTKEQREWCLSEINKVEGYSGRDYASFPDDDIARGVLDAWTDYARDKGLL